MAWDEAVIKGYSHEFTVKNSSQAQITSESDRVLKRERSRPSILLSLFMIYAENRRSVFEHELVMSKFVEPFNLEISPDSLSQGEQAILQEIALQLYARNIFTFSQARRLANLSVWEFQQLLGQQKIQRHYSETELAEDLDTIQADSWQS